VTARLRRGLASARWSRIVLLSAGLVAALATLTWVQPPWAERLQGAWFDVFQVISPRQVATLPVTIVEIDQKSLTALGQWPWPRKRLARLVRNVDRFGPAAIGVNIIMSEPDALSPERLLAEETVVDRAFEERLRSMESYDAVLSAALAKSPAVLGLAGTNEETGMSVRAAPVTVKTSRPGSDIRRSLVQFDGALTSIDELNQQAAGWGLMSVDPTRGIVRRIPLVASVQGTLVPTMGVEMLRVAYRAPTIGLTAAGYSVTSLTVGATRIPTEADGTVRIHFSRHRNDRFVSAYDVLRGEVDGALLRKQLVIIGVTGFGLEEFHDTPLGERMSGSEIQAQLLENLLDGTLLRRPSWAPMAEALLVALLGTFLIWGMTRLTPPRVAVLLHASLAVLALSAFALYRTQRLLFDVATPAAYLLFLFGMLLLLALAEATRQRRSLEGVLQAQRERNARIAGELEAAQRIQTSSLPRADLLHGESRADLHAAMTPAREVGGDLYDFFRLDENRLFLLIGDVSGKGLSASIFMAVSKALYKGQMLREPHADIGDIMKAANAEVSRDNAEMLFVTLFAAILDLRTGELTYCNAGHDNPYRLRPGRAEPERIVDGDGPPLCVVSDYDYRSARCTLDEGEVLCLLTDGVAEAQDPSGSLYGHERAERLVVDLAQRRADPHEVVLALQADVLRFAGGAEPNDDLTILVIRWNGARPAAATAEPS
jgi:serine phosphatase RsbU (regulator of sigma subunit)/CHASE2 domain-containing sensor protein